MQVMRLKNTLKAVEIMELFLEMIKTRLDYLSKQKEIPSEMRTSMLSIAFASTRLTDIPELASIRKSFESRFGREAFSEVTKDPGPASGVQENLLFYLSVLPPSIPAKVDAAMEIMTELGTQEKEAEDLRADLERVCLHPMNAGCQEPNCTQPLQFHLPTHSVTFSNFTVDSMCATGCRNVRAERC